MKWPERSKWPVQNGPDYHMARLPGMQILAKGSRTVKVARLVIMAKKTKVVRTAKMARMTRMARRNKMAEMAKKTNCREWH